MLLCFYGYLLFYYFFYFIFYILITFTSISKAFLRRVLKRRITCFGLYCYTGKQGTGKTYSAVNFLIKNKILHNYIVITNVQSFKVFNDTIYMKNINDIIDFMVEHENDGKKYILFFDEIFTILEKKTSINKKILSFISQLRKRKIIFITTAQEWSEINITFRRYVRFQVSCNMFSIPILKRAFLINKVNDGDGIKWDNDSQDWIAPTIATNFMKGNLSIIESYDTFETIETS